MNRLYFSKFLLVVAVVFGCSINAMAQTVTFTYPSTTTRLYTVPFGASQMTVDIKGARGGYSNSFGSPATGNGFNGSGAEVLATIAVTGGQIFQINLGGAGVSSVSGTNGTDGFGTVFGGTNGGGNGYGRAGGGGGASDIRNLNYAVTNRIVVAAGGGGWGGSGGSSSPYCAGGCGGGLTGESGWYAGSHTTSNTQNNGQGGTQGGGGAKATQAYNQTDGSLGKGGDGANNTATSAYGGGGGGGYYGGGGGAYGGGGGGSSYTDPVYVTASSVSLFNAPMTQMVR